MNVPSSDTIWLHSLRAAVCLLLLAGVSSTVFFVVGSFGVVLLGWDTIPNGLAEGVVLLISWIASILLITKLVMTWWRAETEGVSD